MVFAVYDLGFIRDVGQFSKRFEGRDEVRVVVLTG
jgi:hypothetical protein